MTPAVYDTTTVDFDLGRFLFRATGSVVKFDGYHVLYKEAREAEEGKALEDEQGLPVVAKGENVPVQVDHAVAAFHRAAAALLRGEPGEGAGATRHRPAVHVRIDHLDARRPPLRAARAAPLLPDRARRAGREGDGEEFPEIFNVSSPPRWRPSSTRSRKAN